MAPPDLGTTRQSDPWLLVATTNPGKFAEFADLLTGLPVKLRSLSE